MRKILRILSLLLLPTALLAQSRNGWQELQPFRGNYAARSGRLPQIDQLIFSSDFTSGITAQVGTTPTFSRASLEVGPGSAADNSLVTFGSGIPAIPIWPYKFVSPNGGLFINRASKNLCLYSEAPATAPWAAVGTPTVTNNAASGPDGVTNSAATIMADTSNEGITQDTGEVAANLHSLFAAYVRVATGTLAGTLTIEGSGLVPETTSQAFAATTTWQRITVYKAFSALATGTINAKLTLDATGTMIVSCFMCEANVVGYEPGYIPDPYVKTTNAVAASANDAVAISDINAAMQKGTLSFWHFVTWDTTQTYGSDDSGGYRVIFQYSSSVSDFRAYFGTRTNNSSLPWYYGGSLMGTWNALAAGMLQNTWSHFIVTWDNSGAAIDYRMYWGMSATPTERFSNTTATPTTPGAGSLYLGQHSTVDQRVGGGQGFGRPHIWKVVLNEAERTQVHASEKSFYGY